MKTSIHFWSYLIHFFWEWKMFQTALLWSIFFFRKSCRLWDNVEK